MVMNMTLGLENVPDEILVACFQHLKNSNKKDDIKSLRLTSKRCNQVSSGLLLDFVRVHLMPESLSRFENISKHPVFRKCIRQVEVDVSFYDFVLAEDRLAYGHYCRNRLMAEFWAFREEGKFKAPGCNISTAFRMNKEWRHFGDEMKETRETLPSLTLLENLYQEYCRRYAAQQLAKVDGQYLRMIVEGLLRMPMARFINLNDQEQSSEEWETCFFDEAITHWCLRRMSWNDAVGVPPIEILSELFTAFSTTGTYPTSFKLDLTIPRDLSTLQLSVDIQDHIRRALSQSQHLSCDFRGWPLQDWYGICNPRLGYPMAQLGSLTKAYFSATNLQSLDLSFNHKPDLFEDPTFSFSDVLPAKAWPNLRTVSLRHVPCHERDLEAFVDRQQASVRHLTMVGIHLLTGTWHNCLDKLRRFLKLEHVELSWPTGGEFGNDRWQLKSCPSEETLVSYILDGGRNPLEGFVRE